MKSAKLAKRKPNYSLVQVGGTACLERQPHQPPARCCQPACGLLQDAVAKWEVARRRDVSASERAELVSQLLQQVGTRLACAARRGRTVAEQGSELRAL